MWIVINYSAVLHSMVIEPGVSNRDLRSEDCDLGKWITYCYPACYSAGYMCEKSLRMT